MIVVEGKGRYIDRRAAINCRRAKADKQRRRWAGVLNLLTGALMMPVPALLGASAVPMLLIYTGGICFMAAGAKRLRRELLKDAWVSQTDGRGDY